MILKNRLPFFPPLGTPFYLVEEDRDGRVRVESRPCACRGPDLPHEHYFIRWSGLEAGAKVEIRKDPRRQDRYHLRAYRKTPL